VESAVLSEQASLLIQEADKIPLVVGLELIPLSSILAPAYTIPYDRQEVEQVRKYFGLAANQYPCVIFFEDLFERDFFHNPMPRFPEVEDVSNWFKSLFTSVAFKDLFERVRLKVKSNA
jgi:hypothetical protein